eukprot:TRINITY_DN122128_c0_g1_i1.p1 TRINITY_DN122128_c0_g1~~TRINITY_DN122128_c0_g1_i1.p1  ORF type:complete len:533 (-),score=85.67 TRINITY_DN122128_c0_g1_i1:427-2025(-)
MCNQGMGQSSSASPRRSVKTVCEDPQLLVSQFSEALAVLMQSTKDDPKGMHWRCEERFLALCDLQQDELETHIPKWWGNKEMWLDMFATEIARSIGSKLELDAFLGPAWREGVEAWEKATYSDAVADMASPPSRGRVAVKSAALVRRILAKMSPGCTHSFVMPAVKHVTCEQCQKTYAEALGRCASCSLSDSSSESSTARQQEEEEDIDWKTQARADIREDLDWSSANAVHWCEGGSGGVTLLRLSSGTVCVKKLAPLELLASRLSSALGVRTAQMKAVMPGCLEKKAITKAITSLAATVSDKNYPMGARRTAGQPAFSLIEFVDGCVMMGYPGHMVLRGEKPHPNLPKLWHELGRLVAFDVLINNYDRLPLAWSNEGNLGNVMLDSSLSDVVGIDQAVHPIHHEVGLENYKQRVKKCVLALRNGSDDCLKALTEAVYNNTGATMDKEERAALRSGALELLQQAVSSGAFNAALEQACDAVVSETRLGDDLVGANGRNVCEATMMLEELERSLSQARTMVQQVLSTVKEALA